MSKPVKVFITGSTGYIGGSVLTELLKNPSFEITSLIRKKELQGAFEKIGVKTIIGTIDDHDIISNAVEQSDVAIEVANCDHLGEAKAIVEGMKKKLEKTGKKGIYIQTSGSGIVADQCLGMFKSEEIYSDKDTEKLSAVPESQPHRNVDTYLIANSKYYDLVLITPPCIYGVGTGPKEICNRRTIQIPMIIKAALQNGEAKMVGKGLNVWSNVHIEDLAPLYTIILEKLLNGSLKYTGREGYFFAETGEHQWCDIVKRIADKLYDIKAIPKNSIEECIGQEAVNKAYGYEVPKPTIPGNSRCRADKSREIGWTPKYRGNQYVFEHTDDLCVDRGW